MKKWIERALNIHSGDLGRGSLLCASLFLVITSYVTGKVAGAALFLAHFQAKQLAYADISSSVLVALVVAGYVVILRGQMFSVGDRIAMGGVRGDVIGLRFTQTVIMEMVFRKIEYALEGDAPAQRLLARAPWTGKKLAKKYGVPILLKGGHLTGNQAVDLLFTNDHVIKFSAPFVRGISTHGTGCTYSAAIAAGLASGLLLADAIGRAKKFASASIARHFRWKSKSGKNLDALNH